jgi:AcrR family transcriptional regulator
MAQKKTMLKKRGRPRKDERPDEILEAAFVEFADKGFLATRLDDVATRAGVAKGTVYLYYDSKEALFQAAVRSRMLPVVAQVGMLSQQHDGPTVDLLRVIVRVMYGRLSDPTVRTLMRILIADGQRFPDLIAFYHREVLSKLKGALQAIVARGVVRGEFRKGALTDLPEVLVSPGLMGAIWQMTFAAEEDIPLERFMAAHLDLIERSLHK